MQAQICLTVAFKLGGVAAMAVSSASMFQSSVESLLPISEDDGEQVT